MNLTAKQTATGAHIGSTVFRNILSATCPIPRDQVPKAVKNIDVPIPGTKRFIEPLIEYARNGGTLTVPPISLTGSVIPRITDGRLTWHASQLVISGFDAGTTDLSVAIPSVLAQPLTGDWFDVSVGQMRINKQCILPDPVDSRNGCKLVWPDSMSPGFRVGKWSLTRWLTTTQLLEIEISKDYGTLKMSRLGSLVAPRLVWANEMHPPEMLSQEELDGIVEEVIVLGNGRTWRHEEKIRTACWSSVQAIQAYSRSCVASGNCPTAFGAKQHVTKFIGSSLVGALLPVLINAVVSRVVWWFFSRLFQETPATRVENMGLETPVCLARRMRG